MSNTDAFRPRRGQALWIIVIQLLKVHSPEIVSKFHELTQIETWNEICADRWHCEKIDTEIKAAVKLEKLNACVFV